MLDQLAAEIDTAMGPQLAGEAMARGRTVSTVEAIATIERWLTPEGTAAPG